MEKWREDAQPEWPEAASATRELPADTGDRDRRVTQFFPDSGAADALLRGIPRQSGGEAAETEVLSSEGGRGDLPRTDDRLAVRDPWQQDTGTAEHAHDPHEVTVQLDAVQFGDGVVQQAKGAPGGGNEAASSDGPVFVDESGRRSRRFRRAGMAVGVACAGYAVVIVATLLSGNSTAPWLPVPGQRDDQPAGQVDTSPRPAESAPTADGDVAAPGTTPSADGSTAASPGPTATAPGATAANGKPGTTADPAPDPTRTIQKPGPVTDPTPTQPTDPTTTQAPPDPTPTVEPTPDPTETTGTDDSGGTGTNTGTGTDTGTVADGANPSQPVTESPAEQPGSPSSAAPSPEYVL